ncbi:mannose-6-phosphate isomerase, class I [Cutibacterium equinum]|uniref:mannose-6-phosphate isomerase n=1 Tax=Cutibacterium equinum TaxID=3016342 RepID=A0ABY7QZ64_9ACTN|nr:mannose-6-phosphate isomerase, class I [Cutibacterium equinum]WCC80334.1 mannose-6-phosphate isomerase, class I [Cutibacterium equinum]
MKRLTGTVRTYSWGSYDAIPDILGQEPDGEPWAEYWLGAHDSSPSTLDGTPLNDYLDAHPDELGQRSRDVFGTKLPFLLKILAARHPLSLQAHPDAHMARSGFIRENEAGIDVNDPQRTFVDDWPKPEILVAMSDFEGLCGFRDPHETRQLFDGLDVRTPIDPVLGSLTERSGPAALAETFLDCLAGDDMRRQIVVEVVSGAVNHVGEDTALGEFARTAVELDEYFPGDPSILAALILNRVHLKPGQALAVPPGLMHSYLSGTGIEIMADSNNVVRGGLTDKHIDVDSLIEIVDFQTQEPRIMTAEDVDPGLRVFPSSHDQFRLWELDLDATRPTILPASDLARILLITGGYAVCSSSQGTEEIVHGQAVWIPAGEQVQVDGDCDGFLAAAGL